MGDSRIGSPSISGDGRLVAFATAAANLRSAYGRRRRGCSSGSDVFVRDTAWDSTT